MNITPYEQGNRYNHDPVRSRKLLLHRKEIEQLIGAIERKGLTLVPLELYFKRGRAKVALALGRGKKQHDKREDLKRRIAEREMARAVCQPGTPMIGAAGSPWPSAAPARLRGDHDRRARGETRCPCARAPGRRCSGARRSSRRWAARSRSQRRLGRGDRRPAAVPVPAGRSLLHLQRPAAAARWSGAVIAARHALPPAPVRRRDPAATISASATATIRAGRLVARGARGGPATRAREAGAEARRGPPAQRAQARPHRHRRSRGTAASTRAIPASISRAGVKEKDVTLQMGLCSGTSSAPRHRRADDPDRRHADRPRRSRRLLHRRVRPLRRACTSIRCARRARLHRGPRLRDLLPGRGQDRGRGAGGQDGERRGPLRDRDEAAAEQSGASTSSSRICSSTSTSGNRPGWRSWSSAARSVHTGGDRGVKQAGFMVLTTARRPAILVEMGYSTNPEDASS